MFTYLVLLRQIVIINYKVSDNNQSSNLIINSIKLTSYKVT